MSTHVPLHKPASRSSSKRRRVAIAFGVLGAICIVGVLLWQVARSQGDGLGGTNLTEKELSRAQQIALINEYSPLAIPFSASNIRIQYQRFQDWNFRATFTLPDRDFKAWTARLKLNPKVQLTSDAGAKLYIGKRIGFFTGSITSSPERHQISIDHSSS